MTEADVRYQAGAYWIGAVPGAFAVYRDGATHATADSSYPRTADGLSLAVARAQYLAKRDERRGNR